MGDLVACVGPPGEALRGVCGERIEKPRGFSGLMAGQEEGDADPHHVAGASALEHDSSRPGARSAPPGQAVDQK